MLHPSTDDATLVFSKHKTLPGRHQGHRHRGRQRGPARRPGKHRFTWTWRPGPGPEDLTHDGRFTVDDLITGESWEWGEYNYVRLDPHVEPAHILQLRR